MMKLLKYEGYKVTIEPEMLTLKPFKILWTRDKSKNKENAINDFSFIYFYADPRSDYQYIVDLKDRLEAIKEGQGLPKNWKIDNDLQTAIDYYLSFKPTSALLLEDTRFAIDKLRTLLREVDLKATDDKGKPIYTLNTITSTIKQIPSLVKDLDEAEKALNKDLIEQGRMRGSGEKTLFDDGITL